MSIFSKFAHRWALINTYHAHKKSVACQAIGSMLSEEVFTDTTPNYIEMTFQDSADPSRKVVVTARRNDGESPHQLRKRAEDKVFELEEAQANLVGFAKTVEFFEAEGVAWIRIRTREGVLALPLCADPLKVAAVATVEEIRKTALKAARAMP